MLKLSEVEMNLFCYRHVVADGNNTTFCGADAGNAVQEETTLVKQSHSASDILFGRHSGQWPRDFIHSTQGGF